MLRPHTILFKTLALITIFAFTLHEFAFAADILTISKARMEGLDVASYRLTWDDLVKRVGDYQISKEKVIVHMNSNHYVLVTGIDAEGNVTYYEPNMGENGESITASKEEFINIWKGYALSARAPPEASKRLTSLEAQKIKGAGIFLIISIVLSIISFGLSFIDNEFCQILSKILAIATVIISGIEILTSLLDIANSLVSGIKFFENLFTMSFVKLGDIFSGTLMPFITKTLLPQIGQNIFRTILSIPTTITISRGLEFMGMDSSVARIVTSFVSGGVFGANTAFPTFNLGGALEGLAIQGVTQLGDAFGLDPDLTGIFATAAGAFVNAAGASFNPTTGFNFVKFGDLIGKAVLPNIISELTNYSIIRVGELIGIDPRIANVLGGIGSRTLNSIFRDPKETLGDIPATFNSILADTAVSFGVKFLGDVNPILGSLLSQDLAMAVEDTLAKEGLFNGIFSILKGIVPAAINTANNLFLGITDFVDFVSEKGGIIEAFSSVMSSVFRPETLTSITNQGGLETVFSKSKTDVTLPNGEIAQELSINNDASLFFNIAGDIIGVKDNGVMQTGTFATTMDGRLLLEQGLIITQLLGEYIFEANVLNSQLSNAYVKDQSGNLVMRFDPEKPGGYISINPYADMPDIPSPQIDYSNHYKLWDAILTIVPYGLSLFFGNGVAYAAEIGNNGQSNQSGGGDAATTLYALVNGILNTERDPTKSPDYINNFENDIAFSSNGQYTIGKDFMKSAIYQGFSIPGLDHAKDIINLTFEAMSPILHFMSTMKIIIDFDSRFRAVPSDKSRPIVAMGYSGGFLPLVEAIEQRHYNTDTLIGLGAATTAPLNIPFEEITKILDYVLFGQMGSAANMIAKYLTGIKDISQLGVKRVINVWGTEDVLYQVGIAGKRVSIGGIKTYNIEIEGATHFDYMRRSNETDPAKKEFNRKVSEFVTGLTLASNDDDKLIAFLQDKIGEPGSDGVWRFKP